MATIVISAAGTWGDALPFLALGRELRARGHAVRVSVNEALHALARNAGFEPNSCGPAFGPEDARRMLKPREGWSPIVPEVKKSEAYLQDTPRQYRDLLAACQGADLLIAHSFQYAAMLVHNQIQIPWICVSVTPGQFEHYDCNACTQPAPRATLNLLASSVKFSAPDLELADYVHATGFLFFDGSALAGWNPEPALRAFVEDGEKAIVLALGCIPGPSAQQTAELVSRAAVQLKRKLVIQSGWAEIDLKAMAEPLASGLVRLAGPLPHDWLFSRAAAVVHHGGAGMCARALRNGVPALVLPQRADQFFNARWVLVHGAGAAMILAHMTAEGAERILEEKVLAAPSREAARRLASELLKEDGVKSACNLIEQQFR